MKRPDERHPYTGVTAGALLREFFRSPAELVLFFGGTLVAFLVATPVPDDWQLLAALGLAFVPQALAMFRVQARLVRRWEQRDRR